MEFLSYLTSTLRSIRHVTLMINSLPSVGGSSRVFTLFIAILAIPDKEIQRDVRQTAGVREKRYIYHWNSYCSSTKMVVETRAKY